MAAAALALSSAEAAPVPPPRTPLTLTCARWWTGVPRCPCQTWWMPWSECCSTPAPPRLAPHPWCGTFSSELRILLGIMLPCSYRLCAVQCAVCMDCAWTSGSAVSRPAVTVLSVSRSLCVALRRLYVWESRAMYALFVVTYGVVRTAGSSGAGVTAKGCAVCNPQIHHRVCIVSHAVSHAVAETPQGLRRGRG